MYHPLSEREGQGGGRTRQREGERKEEERGGGGMIDSMEKKVKILLNFKHLNNRILQIIMQEV